MTKVVISASASLSGEIDKWLKFFRGKKFNVLNYPKKIKGDFTKKFPSVHRNFYKSLNKTDIHFVANGNKGNTNNYIGVGVFAEISFAIGLKLTRRKNIRIILSKEPAPDSLFYKDLNLWIKNGWLEIFNENKLNDKIIKI